MYFKVRKNKRSMEYITHMRKLQSINTFVRSYDYTITLIMREKIIISFLRIECYFIWKKTPLLTPFSRMLTIVPSLFEIDPVVLEKENLKILSIYFCFFVIISPWKRAWPFVSTKLNHLHPPKDAFVSSLDEIGSVFLEKMIMWKKIKTDRWKTDNRWSGIGILIVCFTSTMRWSQTARPWHFVNGVLCTIISCLLCFCTLLC